jgi:hypothetical protein
MRWQQEAKNVWMQLQGWEALEGVEIWMLTMLMKWLGHEERLLTKDNA